MYSLIILYIFIQFDNVVSFGVCNQTTTTIIDSYSFCCCRYIQRNLTTNITYVKENSTSTIIHPISFTDSGGSLFNAVKLTCFRNVTADNSSKEEMTECHCTNTHSDLNNHRVSSIYLFKCIKPKIYIGGFFDQLSSRDKALIPAMKIAVDEINADQNFFPEFELSIELSRSTENDLHHHGSDILLDYLYSKHHKLMLLGPDNNILVKTIAAMAGLQRFKIPHFGIGATDTDLITKRTVYPTFFQIDPTAFDFNDARIEILLTYGLKNVGLLYHAQDDYYIQINRLLIERLQTRGINIIVIESFTDNPYGAILSFKNQGVNVILGSYPPAYSSQVFCEIYKQEMFSPQYLFLMMHPFSATSVSSCPTSSVMCAMRDHIFVDQLTEDGQPVISGKLLTSFEQTYKQITNATSSSSEVLIYDLTWTIADIIKRSQPILKTINKNLDQVEYGSPVASSILKNSILTTDIYGLSGRIQFNSNGYRYRKVSVIQGNYEGTSVNSRVGTYDNTALKLTLFNTVSWLGGRPQQKVVIKTTWKYISYNLFLAASILALLGILFALFIFFYVVCRHRLAIVANSFWKLNMLVIVGALLLYGSIVAFGVGSSLSSVSTVSSICKLRVFLFCLGFILLLAPLLAKLYYAHKVYVARLSFLQSNGKRNMLIICLVLFLITFLIVILWEVIHPLVLKTDEEVEIPKIHCSMKVITFDPFVKEIIKWDICSSAYFYYWLVVILIWFFGLVFVAIYYSFYSRSVFIYSMNDTWNCGICVYVILFFGIIGTVGGLLGRNNPNIAFGFIAFSILLGVTAVLIILFLHKIIAAGCLCFGGCGKIFCCLCLCFGCCNDSNGCGRCCRRRCGKCVSCCGLGSDDTMTEEEDRVMYQRYFGHNRSSTSLSSDGRSHYKDEEYSLNDICVSTSTPSKLKQHPDGYFIQDDTSSDSSDSDDDDNCCNCSPLLCCIGGCCGSKCCRKKISDSEDDDDCGPMCCINKDCSKYGKGEKCCNCCNNSRKRINKVHNNNKTKPCCPDCCITEDCLKNGKGRNCCFCCDDPVKRNIRVCGANCCSMKRCPEKGNTKNCCKCCGDPSQRKPVCGSNCCILRSCPDKGAAKRCCNCCRDKPKTKSCGANCCEKVSCPKNGAGINCCPCCYNPLKKDGKLKNKKVCGKDCCVSQGCPRKIRKKKCCICCNNPSKRTQYPCSASCCKRRNCRRKMKRNQCCACCKRKQQRKPKGGCLRSIFHGTPELQSAEKKQGAIPVISFNNGPKRKRKQPNLNLNGGKKKKVPMSSIATQTMPVKKPLLNNDKTAYPPQSLLPVNNQQDSNPLNYESDRNVVVNRPGAKANLKIFSQKLDWSHVKSHIETEGLMGGSSRPNQLESVDENEELSETVSNESIPKKAPADKRRNTIQVASIPFEEKTEPKKPRNGTRRNTVQLENNKPDYSHIKSTIGSKASSPRRVSKAVTSTLENKTPAMNRRPTGFNFKDAVNSAMQENSPVRVVNGPGSNFIPEQPHKRFLKERKISNVQAFNASELSL